MHSYVCTYYSMPLENIKVKIVAFIYIGTDIYIGKRKNNIYFLTLLFYTNAKLYVLFFP